MADQVDRLKFALSDQYTVESLDHKSVVREIQAAPASLTQPHILIGDNSGGLSHAPVHGWRGAGFKARRSISGGVEQ